MKRLILLGVFTFTLAACAVTKQPTSLAGTFKGPTYWMGKPMILSINADQTFELDWLNVNYTGTWQRESQKNIRLTFDKITDLSVVLRSGIISDKEKLVHFCSKNKIQIDHNVLKRVK